ncbi:MAG: DUF1016 family protein [Bacilli bacterium]|nr:DUF1016 family protein [Bacilli bacterium]
MNYYNEIKNELINNEITKRVKNYYINKSDLNTYYNVGKLLADAGKHYGEGIIKNYSKRLTEELGKGYTQTRLKYYRRFFNVFSKCPTLSDELSYSHYCEIIWYDELKMNYYINLSINQKLSVRQLRERIKSNEYERLPKDTKVKLINKEDNNIEDLVKNPIIIHNKNNYDIVSEKILKKLILEDIESFMKELGNYYSFVGSEYKIKIGNSYNYIDLLLFNYEYNCFVVIELKITSLKKEHIGQIEIYMNYIDNNLKKINMDKTIGIIIVKKDNRYIMEYCSDKRILSKEYITI